MAFSSAVAITPVALTPLTAVVGTTLPVTPDATHGNKFIANERTILRVKNGSGAQITVTVNTNRTIDGLTLPDDSFTVAASADVFYTGFTRSFWQNSDREVHVEFSATSSVTVAVYQME